MTLIHGWGVWGDPGLPRWQWRQWWCSWSPEHEWLFQSNRAAASAWALAAWGDAQGCVVNPFTQFWPPLCSNSESSWDASPSSSSVLCVRKEVRAQTETSRVVASLESGSSWLFTCWSVSVGQSGRGMMGDIPVRRGKDCFLKPRR